MLAVRGGGDGGGGAGRGAASVLRDPRRPAASMQQTPLPRRGGDSKHFPNFDERREACLQALRGASGRRVCLCFHYSTMPNLRKVGGRPLHAARGTMTPSLVPPSLLSPMRPLSLNPSLLSAHASRHPATSLPVTPTLPAIYTALLNALLCVVCFRGAKTEAYPHSPLPCSPSTSSGKINGVLSTFRRVCWFSGAVTDVVLSLSLHLHTVGKTDVVLIAV